MSHRNLPARLAALVLAAVATVLLTACGSAGSPASPATPAACHPAGALSSGAAPAIGEAPCAPGARPVV